MTSERETTSTRRAISKGRAVDHDVPNSSIEDAATMNRRDALARLFAITGTVAIGAELFLTGCFSPDAKKRTEAISAAERAMLDEIAETIVPTTDTPGAKAAGVGAFMVATATACYDDATYASFRGGLEKLDRAGRKRSGKPFIESSPAERTELLNELDREQRRHTAERSGDEAPHYFRLMKELALMGYYTSEIGCTQALRYVESPGSYDGNVPYRKGERAFYYPSRRLSLSQ